MTIFIAGSVLDDIDAKYIEESEKVMNYINEKKYKVICCADERGIIGNIYRHIKESHRLILTVPKTYLKYTQNIKEKIDMVTNTINERTDVSIQEADILLIFPGGIGTIYEMFSCLETKKGGEHDKPIIIVNYFGFYDDIVKQLDKLYKEKFAQMDNKDKYYVANTSEKVINYLKACEEY